VTMRVSSEIYLATTRLYFVFKMSWVPFSTNLSLLRYFRVTNTTLKLGSYIKKRCSGDGAIQYVKTQSKKKLSYLK